MKPVYEPAVDEIYTEAERLRSIRQWQGEFESRPYFAKNGERVERRARKALLNKLAMIREAKQ